MNRYLHIALMLAGILIIGTTAIQPAEAVTLYSVRPKDTLAKIARTHNVSIDNLRKANADLRKSDSVKVGQILIIPDADEAVEPSDHSTTIVIHNPSPPSSQKAETPRPAASVVKVDAASAARVEAPRKAEVAAAPILRDTEVIVEPAGSAAPAALSNSHDNIAIIDNQVIRVPSYVPPAPEVEADSVHHRGALASRKGSLISSILSMARRFMGIPYVWGGTTPRGFDCSGFVQRVFAMNGIQLRRTADAQYYQGTPVKDPNPGDLVFFSTYLPGPSHVGIYLGGNQFIHASSRRGVTVSSLSDAYYSKAYIGARRYF